MNRQLFLIALLVGLGLLVSASTANGQEPLPRDEKAASPVDSAPSDPAAPTDTPTVLVSEPVYDWSIGGGLLYWTWPCGYVGLPEDGYLRRMPTYGGIRRTLTTLLRNTNCYFYSNLASDDSGLYYYNSALKRIERRPTSSPYDPPAVVYTITTQIPGVGLILDGSYIYWSSAWNAPASDWGIMRAKNDGSGISTFAITSPNLPSSLAVDSDNIYWLDDSGLWKMSKGCSPLPCTAKQRIVITRGSYIFRHAAYIYWVQHGGTFPWRILRANLDGSNVRTLYEPSAPWLPRQLATDGVSLFWKENFMAEGCWGSRLQRMPLEGGAAVSIADGITSCNERIFTDNLGVYFVGQNGLSWLPFSASALVRDLKADALEVTQGIQNMANDAPLVANKTTYVRLYARELSGPKVNAVEVVLRGFRNGAPLPGSALWPVNGTHALQTGTDYDRARRDDGWLFRLPDSWDDPGPITLEAIVDPLGQYSDPDRSNNTLTGSFTFSRKAPVCTMFIPVRTHAPSATINDPNFQNMIDLFKRLWPVPDVWVYHQDEDIAELEIHWGGPLNLVPYPAFGPYEIPDDDWKIITSLVIRDMFTSNPDGCDYADARTHYVGMVHPNTDTRLDKTNPNSSSELGLANLVLAAAWVKLPDQNSTPPLMSSWTWPREGGVMAQELAHNYNRRHVRCPTSGPGQPSDPDPDWPSNIPPCQLDNVSPIAYYGFDANSQTPIPPDGASDFMSYHLPQWVSDYAWEALFSRINPLVSTHASNATWLAVNSMATVSENDSAATLPNLSAASSIVQVSGVITPSLYQGYLNYAWVFPGAALGQGLLRKWQSLVAPAVAARTSGDAGLALYNTGVMTPTYHLQLLDTSGTALDDRLLTSLQNDTHNENPSFVFALTFPAPIGAVARLNLMVDNTVLASLTPGTSTPIIGIIKPAGGETFDDQMTVVWRASDVDSSDRLLYTIQYSPDQGQTWRALVTGLPGPLDSDIITLSLKSLSGLPGSTTGGSVRVAASDGYHTAVATSQPFQVTNRPPQPYIVSPAPGESFAAGESAALRGGATDAESGGLSGTALRWTVDGRADGTGQEQQADGLAPGLHEIALTAQDPAGLTRTFTTALNVAPLSISLGSEPTLDGACDDAAYAGSTVVQLSPYPDGGRATVHMLRTATDLWVCFGGMNRTSGGPGSFAGVRVDVNNSRDALAQSDDYGLFVGEDGTPSSLTGDGAGSFNRPGPAGLLARASANAAAWNAELRIPATLLGGWNHVVGLALGQYWVRFQGDDYYWPFTGWWNAPSTWALTALGNVPQIARLDPDSTIVGSAARTLTVTGTDFVNGAKVRWSGVDRPTTFISSTQLQAAISASDVVTPGMVQVTVVNPGLSSAPSNAVIFTINNPAPTITHLNPTFIGPGGAAFTLTVEGTNFIKGATVLWNGDARPTTMVSRTQLRVDISTADRAAAYTAGLTVINPGPGGGASNVAMFTVGEQRIFLPIIVR